MSIKYSVDNLFINEYRGKTRIMIDGWAVATDGTIPKHRLFINGKETKCSDVSLGRGDVISVLKLKDESLECGFAICVREFPEIVKSVYVVAETESENRKIVDLNEKMTEQMKERHSFIAKLENVSYNKGTNAFELSGWKILMNHGEEVRFDVLKDSGNIENLSYRKGVRDDLVSMNYIDKEDKLCGFFVDVPAERNEKITLVIRRGHDPMNIPVKTQTISKSIAMLKLIVRSLNSASIKQGLKYFKRNGFKRTLIRVAKGYDPVKVYDYWLKEHRVKDEELTRQRNHTFSYSPKISLLVPTYNTPLHFLKEMIETVQNQTYSNWELCIADGSKPNNKARIAIKEYAANDSRIKVVYLDKNYGISGNTNKALELATGDYIAPYDHDDFLELNALYEIVNVLNQNKYDIIYTDEDKYNEATKKFDAPNLKPDYSIDLLRSHNYITHLFVVRADIMKNTGGFHEEYDGSQDYDMILRCIEQAKSIYHLPKLIYHWRMHPGSTAEDPESKMYCYEAGQRAIQDHLNRIGVKGKVEMLPRPHFGLYHVKYDTPGNPLVSVIIPNYENKKILKQCVDSLFKKNDYQNFEIIIVENNSKSDEIFAYYKEIEAQHDNVHVVTWQGKEFNYSAINNYGVQFAKGEYLLFLNNDTEVISPSSVREMLGCCMREEVGAVGAKLLYENNTVQHAGVVIGVDDVACHVFRGIGEDGEGFMMRPLINCNYSAVTAACMMTKKSLFEQVGGFEEDLKVAFNDIDYCLKIREQNKYIVYNAFALWHHYESISRGYETTPEKQERFLKEIKYIKSKWHKIYEDGDPFYNANFDVTKAPFSL